MTRLNFREYDPQAARLAQFIRAYECNGEPVVHSVPAPGTVLMQFSDADGTAVLVDLRAWCGERQPVLARLATDLLGADDLKDWFHYGNNTCELVMPSGTAVALADSQPARHIPVTPLPEVMTSLGRGWLVSAAGGITSDVCFFPRQLSFCLSLVLGESLLRQRYVNRLQCGDVLIISRFVEEVRYGHRRLGPYQLKEDVFMFEDFAEEEMPAEQAYTMPDYGESYLPQGLQNMPVKLEFIVHEKVFTLDELCQLSAGAVLGLPEHGKDSISIRANGALIGRGELIWVEDKLCVEVQTLFSGRPDGK